MRRREESVQSESGAEDVDTVGGIIVDSGQATAADHEQGEQSQRQSEAENTHSAYKSGTSTSDQQGPDQPRYLMGQKTKEWHVKKICQYWKLSHIDELFTLPEEDARFHGIRKEEFKPPTYSDHLLRRLWAIARDLRLPLDEVRSQIASVVLDEPQHKYGHCVRPESLRRVLEKFEVTLTHLDLSLPSYLSTTHHVTNSSLRTAFADLVPIYV